MLKHHKVESHMLRKRDFMRKWRVSGAQQTQMNWCWDWEISMVMLGNELKDLKVYMDGME